MTIIRHEELAPELGYSRDLDFTVVHLVSARARTHPTALALVAGGRSMTYGELELRAGRVADRLRATGIGRDALVGLCLPGSVDMVVGALAIMRAGGAYVPLDPSYPPERLAFMLDDARAPLLVSTAAAAARLPAGRWELVDLADPAAGSPVPTGPAVRVQPGDLAYVIYTSGSTGRPKGVEITHRNLCHLVAWHREAFAVKPTDRASQVASPGFDATVWEIWPYLAAGASVHFAGEDTRTSPELLRDWLLAHGITIGFVPTPLVEPMLALEWPRTCDLRVVLTGGDALHHYPPPGLPFRLINNYGPTECTVVATSGPVPPAPAPVGAPPIGRAISHARVYLLDEHRRPVTRGEPGEIYIGGAGVGRGYHGRRELTAQRFVPDPFSGVPGARLYRTGDLGRLLPDGQFAFLGRTDDQIKIRGYRIEPGEISAALVRHPAVRGCAVVLREDAPGYPKLVAYIVPAPEAVLSHAELRNFLGEFLPEYMLPAAFVRLEALPQTPHGKVDRAALPAPDATNLVQDEAGEFACTETEERIAGILGELLGLDEIGLEDNFFMLGGHSLLGAQVIARLRDAFGIELSLRSLFEAPTVAELAVEVERLAAGGEPAAGAPGVAGGCAQRTGP